jgi:hypothetical protein
MVWLLLVAAMQVGPPAPELRFHHVHLQVPDQAAAMNEIAERVEGQRLILQGHGPAVRAGDRYVVFDSAPELLSKPGERDPSGASAYDAALQWARNSGLIVAAPGSRTEPLSAGMSLGRITVVAFSSATPPAAIDTFLRAKGVDPTGKSDDTVRYRVSPELLVEIISETDRPDTHWCPMHPAVRAAGPSRCPVCSMDMVPIPPPRVGEYGLDVAVSPASRKSAAFTMRMTVRSPHDGAVVTSFLPVHERPFHLFIVSRDLATFVHAHPERHEDGTFVLEQALAPGEYMLIADFLPAGGTPQVVHRAIVTPGYAGTLFRDPPKLAVTPAEQTIDGLRVKLLAGEVTALRPAALRFVVADAATGADVRDLEPYLGATGHLLLVNPALTSALHGHPAGAQTAGPEILFDPVLPKPGMYKLWLQFQRKGRIVTVPFVIEVAPL